MNQFSGMLLACDMDGTLLNDERQVSAKNQKALERFTEEGGRLVLATGRAFRAVQPYLNQLPVNAPYILLNGALIMDEQGKIQYCAGMPAETVELIKVVLSKFSQIGCEIFLSDHILIPRISPVTARHMETLHLSYTMISSDELGDPNAWCQINFTGEPETIESVRRLVRSYGDRFYTASSLPTFCEVTRPRVHKGSALQRIAAAYGIEKQNIFAIGDSHNDSMLLQSAHLGLAPGNAVEDILQCADVIVSDNNHDAIADVIDYLKAHF
jgi:Cof subfamily protein (haloacid dehalogenase superfamily)